MAELGLSSGVSSRAMAQVYRLSPEQALSLASASALASECLPLDAFHAKANGDVLACVGYVRHRLPDV
jgi:hypothetical protein